MLAAYPYVPIADRLRTGVAVTSYGDQLLFGITADRQTVPDIDVLRDGLLQWLHCSGRPRRTKETVMNREPDRAMETQRGCRMDSPTNLMVVNSVLWFDDTIDEDAMRAVLDERLVSHFRRFRQRVVHDHGIWSEDMPDFDLSDHIHHLALPRPSGRRELRDPGRVIFSSPCPSTSRGPCGTSTSSTTTTAARRSTSGMHHCIADGIALTRVLLSLTDGGEAWAGLADDTDEGHRGIFSELASTVLHETVTTVTHPKHVLDLASAGVSDVRALTKLLVLPPDHRYWGRKTGLDKQVVWSDPFRSSSSSWPHTPPVRR